MAAVLDQTNSGSPTGYENLRDTTSHQKVEQTFTAAVTGGVTKIVLELFKNTAPTGNMWVEIWSDNAGVPGSKLGGSSSSLDVSTLSALGPSAINFTWSGNYPFITAGAKYHAVGNGDFTIDGTNYVFCQLNTNAGFSIIQTYNGSTWATDASNREIFDEWVDSSLAPPSGGYALFL